MRLKDMSALEKSTSGGAAYGIACYIISEGGAVYGAAYDTGLTVRHIRVDDTDSLSRLRGSKYVQSLTDGIYERVQDDLDSGRPVLFIGTACQVAGLYAALCIDHDNLYTAEIICYGVPSPAVWGKYVNEELLRRLPCEVNMRDKATGWNKSSFSVTHNRKRILEQPLNDNAFLRLFLHNYGLRPECYDCGFKSEMRCGDLTLGDCWGLEEMLPGHDDDRGMSVVFVNSKKGRLLLDGTAELFDSTGLDAREAVSRNMMALKSVIEPPDNREFISDIERMTVKKAAYKYIPKDPFILRVKKKLYPLKVWLMRFIKKGA